MKYPVSCLSLFLGATLASVAFAPAAFAGCGMPANLPRAHKSAFVTEPDGKSALFELASFDAKGIVGMWSMSFVSGNTQIDFGYSVWHSDGTEILNSGSRAPSTENFCLGVWKKTAINTYKLNHFALSYDSSGNLNARVNIKEAVGLAADGDSFSGPFSIQAYDPGTGAPLGPEVDGTVTGTRIKVGS